MVNMFSHIFHLFYFYLHKINQVYSWDSGLSYQANNHCDRDYGNTGFLIPSQSYSQRKMLSVLLRLILTPQQKIKCNVSNSCGLLTKPQNSDLLEVFARQKYQGGSHITTKAATLDSLQFCNSYTASRPFFPFKQESYVPTVFSQLSNNDPWRKVVFNASVLLYYSF